jgi:hypothetical protein
MIEQILELIVDGRIVDKKEIAREVGIQEETLNDMIDLLCQRGYLRVGEQHCGEDMHCSGCSLADTCGSTDKFGRVLYVTEKARQYLKARRKRKDE